VENLGNFNWDSYAIGMELIINSYRILIAGIRLERHRLKNRGYGRITSL
jgi:hypothetical protein